MKYLFAFLGVLVSHLGKAQTTANLIAASGETKGISVTSSWALGEVVNETFKSSTLEVSHGLNDQNFKYLITGVIEEYELRIYPIPFIESFQIVSTDKLVLESIITLLDVTGKQVSIQIQKVIPNQITVFPENSAPGLYLLTLGQVGSTKSLTIKLIKE